jgi:beta-lactam-binding protein with PASTA domain
VVIVLLIAGVLLATSRSTTSATVPDLVGERVDPQLDGLRLRLAAAGLVLRNVSTARCPTVNLPGASLEELPGTIINQHPAAGKKVEVSGAVDVTVCLPA